MSIATTAFLLCLLVLSYLIAPFTLIFGWMRWTQQPKRRTVSSMSSLFGFVLATGSAALAVSISGYAQVHHFRFYDPFLMRTMKRGALLSLAGLVCSLGGVWRKNSLRWLSPASAVGTLAFWVLAAEGE
jgi:hypothetical protein